MDAVSTMTKRTVVTSSLALAVALCGCASPRTQVANPVPVPPMESPSADSTVAPQPQTVAIPIVRDKSVELAEWKLEQAGLVSKVRWKSSSKRRGKVLAQSPSSGVAALGSVVTLTVSKGPSGGAGNDETASEAALSAADQAAKRAFDERRSDIGLSGSGTVTSVLGDDTNGSRHQRFILRLESGQTLLIAHNIDIAPRLPALESGDRVSFKGVYEWNDKGGTVHWTHDDPDGSHPGGWLKFDGRTYR